MHSSRVCRSWLNPSGLGMYPCITSLCHTLLDWARVNHIGCSISRKCKFFLEESTRPLTSKTWKTIRIMEGYIALGILQYYCSGKYVPRSNAPDFDQAWPVFSYLRLSTRSRRIKNVFFCGLCQVVADRRFSGSRSWFPTSLSAMLGQINSDFLLPVPVSTYWRYVDISSYFCPTTSITVLFSCRGTLQNRHWGQNYCRLLLLMLDSICRRAMQCCVLVFVYC